MIDILLYLCFRFGGRPAGCNAVNEILWDQILSFLNLLMSGWPATHEQIQKAKYLVPEDLIDRITASGTPTEAKAKVQEYIDHGCTCPILYPVGGSATLLIDTFAPEVG